VRSAIGVFEGDEDGGGDDEEVGQDADEKRFEYSADAGDALLLVEEKAIAEVEDVGVLEVRGDLNDGEQAESVVAAMIVGELQTCLFDEITYEEVALLGGHFAGGGVDLFGLVDDF
jgi:hypothetical protein